MSINLHEWYNTSVSTAFLDIGHDSASWEKGGDPLGHAGADSQLVGITAAPLGHSGSTHNPTSFSGWVQAMTISYCPGG